MNALLLGVPPVEASTRVPAEPLPGASMAALGAWFREANRAPAPPGERMAAVGRHLPPVREALERHLQAVLDGGPPGAEALAQAWMQIASACKHAIRDLYGKAAAPTEDTFRAALEQGTEALGVVVLLAWMNRRQPPRMSLLELHQIRLAAAAGAVEVVPGLERVDRLYKTVMILAMADPYAATPAELARWWRLVPARAQALRILPAGRGPAGLWVDPTADRPPGSPGHGTRHGLWRLDPEPLIEILRQERSAPGGPAPEDAAALQQLARRLGHRRRRAGERRASGATVTLGWGTDPRTWGRAEGPAIPATVVDAADGGWRLRTLLPEPPPQPGTLVWVRFGEEAAPEYGLLRWLRQDGRELDWGVERIPGHPLRLQALPEGVEGLGSHGLYFPPRTEPLHPAALLLPRGLAEPGHPLQLLVGDKRFRVVPGARILESAALELIRFRRLPPRNQEQT